MDSRAIYEGKTISQWSKETGLKAGTIAYRLRSGWSLQDAISKSATPPNECAKKHDVLGKTFRDRFGNKFVVEELAFRDKYSVAYYKCVFPKSGYETVATVSRIVNKNKRVQDRYSPSVHNIGVMGDAYSKDNPKLFNVWRAMIARCYNPKNPSYKTYGAIGVTVCDRWKRFDWFLEDIKHVKGFDQTKIDNGELVLDKDIINREAKTYSLETCCFVTRSENTRESSLRRKERKA